MSDLNDDQNPPESEGIRNLREANERKDAEIKELRGRALRGAFIEAGVPVTGAGQLLLETYAGELDPDAIKAEATKYGLLDASGQPASQTPEPPADPGDVQNAGQVDERRALGTDTLPPGTQPENDPDRIDKAFARRDDQLSRGMKREDAGAEVFGEILRAGAAGDPRFRMKDSSDNSALR